MKLIQLTPLKKVITLDNRLIKIGLPFITNNQSLIYFKSFVNNLPNVDIIVIKKVITFRRKINQLLRIPFRFTNIKIPVRTVIYSLESETILKKSSANIATRIETYKNKQVVRVYVDVKARFLRPI